MLNRQFSEYSGLQGGVQGWKSSARMSAADNLILRRLMWPLAATLLLVAVIVAMALWRQQELRLDDAVTQRVEEIPKLLQGEEARQLAVMDALLKRITADSAVREALHNRDRERLLSENRELMEELRSKHGISHFYFQDANRNNIVRMQFPEKRGGKIERYTTLEAERTGEPAGGLELGTFGLLTLRMVHPVFSEGKLIGFVELGRGMNDVLAGMAFPDDVEVALTLHKDVVTRGAWVTGMELIRQDFDWDDFPDDVLVYSSVWPIPAGFLREYLAEHDHGHRDGDGKAGETFWRAATVPVMEASGREVGHLIVMLDISAQKADFRRMVGTTAGLSALMLALLMGFLFHLLRKADAQFSFQRATLQMTEARQQAIFDTVIDGIVMIDERGRIELVNPAFHSIFGYQPDEVRGRNVSMLMPEPDRSAHDGYLRNYLSSGEAKIIRIGREVLGQRKDGSVFPMDLAVSETLIDGRRLFTGLVRDITARKQAEAELIESLQLQREYQHHACVDVLTGLHNRRWLDETFARQIARSNREGQALGLIMLDVDHFKQYNDTHGHFGGDCALRALGKAIADHIRPNDLAARYGGEEFAILLPGSSVANTVAIAERLRAAVEKTPILKPDGTPLPSITLSLGLSEMKPGDTLETLIASADAALYRAKQKGRNCVST
jgi:diguanylate cyclase (GGDEF)-like protein/PAS domain S-box-containing protein